MDLPSHYHLVWIVFKTMLSSYSHKRWGLLLCNNMIRYLPRSLASNKYLPFVAFVREIIICLDSQANL